MGSRQVKQSEPANNDGIRPNINLNATDERAKKLFKNILAAVVIFVISGKCTEYLVNNYVMDNSTVGASELSKAGE